MANGLPDEVADLLPFLDWTHPDELERNEKRWSATAMEDGIAHEVICAQLKSGAEQHIHFQGEEILVRHLGSGVDLCVRGLD